MNFTYTIEPRAAEMGGGWSLKLFQGDEEMGGGVFPAAPGECNDDPDFDQAYQDAIDAGENWVA